MTISKRDIEKLYPFSSVEQLGRKQLFIVDQSTILSYKTAIGYIYHDRFYLTLDSSPSRTTTGHIRYICEMYHRDTLVEIQERYGLKKVEQVPGLPVYIIGAVWLLLAMA